MVLDDIKLLLGIGSTDTSKDSILNLYIRRSETAIKNYINNSSFDNGYIQANFQDAIIEIVVFAYRNKGNENIKSVIQGARSVTYADGSTFAITETVKDLLPTPYVKMF